MKLMPGEDFLKLLSMVYSDDDDKYVWQSTIDKLFEAYGDDIYPRSEDPDDIVENKERKRILEEYESKSINKSTGGNGS